MSSFHLLFYNIRNIYFFMYDIHKDIQFHKEIFKFTKKCSSSQRNVKFMKKCSCSQRNVQVHKEMFKFMNKYSSSRRNVHKAKTCLLRAQSESTYPQTLVKIHTRGQGLSCTLPRNLALAGLSQ